MIDIVKRLPQTLGFILVSTALLSSCGETEQPMESAKAAPLRPLPLEKRLLSEKSRKNGTKTIKKHYAAFGNWISECVFSNDPAKARRTTWCDVYPWNGKQPKRYLAITPYRDRATVQFFNEKPAKIVLRTSKREHGSTFSYQCGPSRWQGPSNANRLKFFYDTQALPFLGQMRSRDCTLEYQPAGTTEVRTITHTAHGFREAFTYAQRYVRVPS